MMHNTAYQTVSNKESISCNPNAIYGDVAHHICCLIPVYIDGGDCTACYYVDGRRDIIHKSIKTVLREIARHEGVLANGIEPGPEPHTTYIIIGDFDPILVFHSPDHVQRKLRDALLEHLDYTKRILAKLSTCGNPYVVAEIYGASRTLAGV